MNSNKLKKNKKNNHKIISNDYSACFQAYKEYKLSFSSPCRGIQFIILVGIHVTSNFM